MDIQMPSNIQAILPWSLNSLLKTVDKTTYRSRDRHDLLDAFCASSDRLERLEFLLPIAEVVIVGSLIFRLYDVEHRSPRYIFYSKKSCIIRSVRITWLRAK